MIVGPNLTHGPCDLDRQQRLAAARREAVAGEVARRRRRGRRGWFRARPATLLDAGVFRPAGEDVWHALRD